MHRLLEKIAESVNALIAAHNAQTFDPIPFKGLAQPATEAQFRAIHAIARSRGVSPDGLRVFVRDNLVGITVEELTIESASYIIRELQKL